VHSSAKRIYLDLLKCARYRSYELPKINRAVACKQPCTLLKSIKNGFRPDPDSHQNVERLRNFDISMGLQVADPLPDDRQGRSQRERDLVGSWTKEYP
jgi:hypothetical protein